MRPLRTLAAQMSAIAGLLVFATLNSTTASAQQRGDTARAPRTPNAAPRAPQGPMRGERGLLAEGPRARGARQGGNPAAQLLRMRGPLNLTNDQVSRLEKLAEAQPPRANQAELMRARADLMEAMQGNGNLAGARAALDKMSRLRNEQTVAGLKLRQDARAVLTADQQRTLESSRNRVREVAMRGMIGRERAARANAMRARGGMRRGPMGPPMARPMGPQGRGRMAPEMRGQFGPRMGPPMGNMQRVPDMPERGMRMRRPQPPIPPEMLDVDHFENSDSHIAPR
ncbi:MAG: Spy/CpxP family protein refolding chaperone [Gemmatimonadaceae bacterium]|nr:Spy/CpxP family protein refolding chaperone [Gemmatimonadaceae bacterium]